MSKSTFGFKLQNTGLDTVATRLVMKKLREECLRQYKPDVPVIPDIVLDTSFGTFSVMRFEYWSGSKHIAVSMRVGVVGAKNREI